MPSFQNCFRRKLGSLNQAIQQLQDRWEAMEHISFTHQEFLDLMAPKEDHDLLQRAGAVALITGSRNWTVGKFNDPRVHEVFPTAKVVAVMFDVSDVIGRAPLLPRNDEVLNTAPQELRDRLCNWILATAKIRIDFNRVRLLVNWLDDNCASPSQARFLFPSIIQLMMLSEETKELGDSLRDVKPAKFLPSMPPEIREACRLASATVATAALLPTPVPFNAPVTVRINEITVRIPNGELGTLTA